MKAITADEVAELWAEHCHGLPQLAPSACEQIAETMTAMRNHRKEEFGIGRGKDDRRAAEAVRRLLRDDPPRRGQVQRDMQVIRRTCDAWLAPIEQALTMRADWLPPTGPAGFNALARLRDLLTAADADRLASDAALCPALRDALPVLAPRTPPQAPVWEPAGVAMWCMVNDLLHANDHTAGTSKDLRGN